MSAFSRRALLGQVLAVAACKRSPPAKEQVLESLVNDIVVPDLQAILIESRRLEAATAALERAPTALETARGRWRETVLAWKRASCFRRGPLVTSSALSRALFWPVRAQAIATLARGRRTVDDALVSGLGVDEKGLFAIEPLLFDAGEAPVQRDGAEGERARRLATVLARAVTGNAAAATAALGDGHAYAAAFARKGQESVVVLANQLPATIEIARLRLAGALACAGRPVGPSEIEGLAGGLAFEIPRTLVAGVQRFYDQGIGALARAVAPAIDAHVRTLFAQGSSDLDALAGVSLARALDGKEPALAAADRAIRELEAALKVDVATALGVTLIFNGADGD